MDEAEWTPLMIAVSGNKPDVANLLINRNANPNAINRTGIADISLSAAAV